MTMEPFAECLFAHYAETVIVFLHGKVSDYVCQTVKIFKIYNRDPVGIVNCKKPTHVWLSVLLGPLISTRAFTVTPKGVSSDGSCIKSSKCSIIFA